MKPIFFVLFIWLAVSANSHAEEVTGDLASPEAVSKVDTPVAKSATPVEELVTTADAAKVDMGNVDTAKADLGNLDESNVDKSSVDKSSVDKSSVDKSSVDKSSVDESMVEVGKHVTANMDAMSMILSLLMVLAVIVISAVILKRFQGVRHSINGLKIVTSLHLGAKEKLVVVQAGEKQLLLGVTAQQISLIETLDEPLISAKENSVDFAQSIAKLLKQKAIKTYDKQQ